MALPSKPRRIINPHGDQEHPEPSQDAWSNQKKENNQEGNLSSSDFPSQRGKLFRCAQRPEQKSPLARVQPVRFRIHNVIHAIQKKSQRKQYVEEPQPQRSRMQKIRMAQRHQIKQRRRAPKPGPRNLQKKNELRGPRAFLHGVRALHTQGWQARFQSRFSSASILITAGNHLVKSLSGDYGYRIPHSELSRKATKGIPAQERHAKIRRFPRHADFAGDHQLYYPTLVVPSCARKFGSLVLGILRSRAATSCKGDLL